MRTLGEGLAVAWVGTVLEDDGCGWVVYVFWALDYEE